MINNSKKKIFIILFGLTMGSFTYQINASLAAPQVEKAIEIVDSIKAGIQERIATIANAEKDVNAFIAGIPKLEALAKDPSQDAKLTQAITAQNAKFTAIKKAYKTAAEVSAEAAELISLRTEVVSLRAAAATK